MILLFYILKNNLIERKKTGNLLYITPLIKMKMGLVNLGWLSFIYMH